MRITTFIIYTCTCTMYVYIHTCITVLCHMCYCIHTGGDQLTVARGRSSKRIRSNSTHGKDHLEGLVPVVEDWHAKVSLLGVRTYLHYCIVYPVHVHVVYL